VPFLGDSILAPGIIRDMNPVFIAVTHREYIHVGSAPASLLETVTSTNTEFISLSPYGTAGIIVVIIIFNPPPM
jgi:hypothetical protein